MEKESGFVGAASHVPEFSSGVRRNAEALKEFEDRFDIKETFDSVYLVSKCDEIGKAVVRVTEVASDIHVEIVGRFDYPVGFVMGLNIELDISGVVTADTVFGIAHAQLRSVIGWVFGIEVDGGWSGGDHQGQTKALHLAAIERFGEELDCICAFDGIFFRVGEAICRVSFRNFYYVVEILGVYSVPFGHSFTSSVKSPESLEGFELDDIYLTEARQLIDFIGDSLEACQ